LQFFGAARELIVVGRRGDNQGFEPIRAGAEVLNVLDFRAGMIYS
jgi:hypothetical protein